MRWGRGESVRIWSMDQCWLYVELILSFISPRNIFPAPLAKGEIIDYINLANVCKELGLVPSPEIAVVTVTQ